MASFVLSFFPLDVLDEIWNLIESVSEGFLTYSFMKKKKNRLISACYVCVYSNSRNDVPRVAQRYGTIAAHTRRRASVLVVFVVFACTCTVLPV